MCSAKIAICKCVAIAIAKRFRSIRSSSKKHGVTNRTSPYPVTSMIRRSVLPVSVREKCPVCSKLRG